MKSLRSLWAIPLALLLAGCASSGGSGGTTFSRDLGRQLVPTFEEARLKTWNKHNWALVRDEVDFQTVYWESDWRAFDPEGPAVTGPDEARGRIVVRGRRVGGELDGGSLYRMTFVGEYEVRGGAMDSWTPMSPPNDAERVFNQVLGDLELEIRTGVRR